MKIKLTNALLGLALFWTPAFAETKATDEPENETSFRQLLGEEMMAAYQNKYNDLFISGLIPHLFNLLNKISSQEQIVDLMKMINLLQKNCEFLIGTLNNIRQYCSLDGKINSKDIYSTDSKILL